MSDRHAKAIAQMSRDARLWRERAAQARRRKEPASAAVYDRLAAECEAKASRRNEVIT
jgi:hypothetical protein